MKDLNRMLITARTLHVGALALALAAFAAPTLAQTYSHVDLVDNVCCGPERFDKNLNEAWGVAMGAAGPAWVASSTGGRATLYDGTGVLQTLVVRLEVPPQFGTTSPAGIVSNSGGAFVVTDESGQTGPARFIFSTIQGTIAAWKPPAAGHIANTLARIVVDNSEPILPQPDPQHVQRAHYTGLAINSGAGGDFLYAANFLSGHVEMFDGAFAPVAAGFQDPQLPAGFAPFNVRVLNGKVYVAYAAPAPLAFDPLTGAGRGHVDVFGLDGTFQRRLVTGGVLNAPWGLALAPAGFGPLSGALLVANYGDGRINGFNPDTGQFVGTLSDDAGPMFIDGVHGIQFGNGTLGQSPTTLYYTAAPTFAAVGVYGRIDFGVPFHIPVRCAGDFNDDGRVNTQDIFDFLSSWFSGSPSADTDHSGALNVQDVIDFLGAWFGGVCLIADADR